MDDRQRIAKLVSTYRNQKKLTQKALADKLGIAQQRINELETHHRIPTLKNLKKIAKALEIPPEKVLDMKPIGDATFEKFVDDLNKAPELYGFISHFASNKKDFKGFDLIAIFDELVKTPLKRRRKLMKELYKLRLMVEAEG